MSPVSGAGRFISSPGSRPTSEESGCGGAVNRLTPTVLIELLVSPKVEEGPCAEVMVTPPARLIELLECGCTGMAFTSHSRSAGGAAAS